MLNSQVVDESSADKVLRNISIENTVNYEGIGTFFKFISGVKRGTRELIFSDDGRKVIRQEYTELPRAAVIERYGASKLTQVALTFDDGPDRQFTTAILDTLKATNTPATFFVVGANMLNEPDLVKRIYNEGHEIGSHTFWHPKMDEISHVRLLIELNAVQKLLIDITGHTTKLFREPFLRSQGPFSIKETEATQIAQSQGYIIAGSDIVPPDWTGISAKKIEEFVVGKVTANEGNVVLMHDAGNDRSQTVAAVPKIIKALRSEGYEIVPLSEILGVDRHVLMPPVTNYQDIVSGLTFRFASNIWDAFNYIFWFVIIFGVVRSLSMLILAMFRRSPKLDPNYRLPDVTVIIPAFNEETVVQDCLKSVLQSDYPNLKIIVVDDGSNDETLHEVLRKISDRSDVQLICQLNHGKWRALNAAYSIIDTEIAVSIDADTRIEPDTIKNLVRHFHDSKVGAVAGKVVVGNRINFLSKLQALEYIVAQNIDRRAAELFNGILVVPGAIGAWRVSAVREAGLYSGVTQTEDADLTISLNRAGYRVLHEQLAIGVTEAPTTIQSLLTQRLRWSLGMLQNSWKHRGAMLRCGFLGQVALPDLLIFGYLFALLAPIADLYFFILIFNAISSMISSGVSVVEIGDPGMIVAYLVLPLLDTITAFIAIRIDKSESLWFLLLLPLQRLLYRQLLYIAVFRAISKACTGRAAKWGKLERTGNIQSSKEVTQ